MSSKTYWILALMAGGLLGCMVFFNGMLAHSTNSTWASFVTHFVGAGAAGVLVMAFRKRRPASMPPAPRWAYLGGVPGALTVILANITVNTPLGLSGSLSLMLLGQVVFALLVDSLGWFQLPKRSLTIYDFTAVLAMMSGSAILVFFARSV